eukprot:CAMPEP_0168711820 /NCGR_PEP_ID=MMETSP0503-20121227/43346_1 /TAXON_ID=89963 /ORGANISM="Heterocapsa rotundata, Strain SCCAP K-0483" /LENGTH=42 /DNA_ID= /DNA_START= /DNA_END= /DNA_ORIENTATION=
MASIKDPLAAEPSWTLADVAWSSLPSSSAAQPVGYRSSRQLE